MGWFFIRLHCLYSLAMIVVGIAVVALGVKVELEYARYRALFHETLMKHGFFAKITCAFGAVLIIIGFCNLVGNLLLDICIIFVSLCLLVVLFVAVVVTGIFSVIASRSPSSMLSKFQNMTFDYQKNQTHSYELSIVQHQLSCCGYDGPSDYDTSETNGRLPSSCCDLEEMICNASSVHHFKRGCKKVLEKAVRDNSKLIFQYAVLFGFFIVIGIIFTIISLICLRKWRKRGYNYSSRTEDFSPER